MHGGDGMNWHQHPNVVDQLAAAYVMGTLQGPARRRFEAVLQWKPELNHAVTAWTERLVPMLTSLPPMQPGAGLWQKIAQRAGIVTAVPVQSAWWRRWLGPIPAGALTMGLLLGAVLPQIWQAQIDDQQGAQMPQSYVGVLANAKGQTGVIVSSLRRGRVVEIKQPAPAILPVGRELHLWRIDKEGKFTSLGPVPNEKWARIELTDSAEKIFFPAVELAISSELQGSRPAQPQLPMVYRGLCGKLWK
jgi:anti-sigma-K factor RskA